MYAEGVRSVEGPRLSSSPMASSLVSRAGQLLHSLAADRPGPSTASKEAELAESFLELLVDDSGEMVAGPIGVKIMTLLATNRICNEWWVSSRPSPRWLISLLHLARGLVREKAAAEAFHNCALHANYVTLVDGAVRQFSACPSDSDKTRVATASLNVLQKVVDSKKWAVSFVEARVHKAVLPLLHCQDMDILQAALEVLGRLSDWSSTCRSELCATTAVDVCLQLSAQSDLLTQKLCVSLLRILACETYAREQMKIYDGIPLLVSLLSVRNSRLQWHVAWTLAQLADDNECALEIGQRGAISVVLAELGTLQPPSRAVTDWISMLTGMCALFAQLCQVDSNETLIVRNNGLFTLGQILLLPLKHPLVADNQQFVPLMCSVLRVLRLVFSSERNRHFFKRVFDHDSFGRFIDIGHYVQDLSAYKTLADEYLRKIRESEEPEKLYTAWDTLNQDKAPLGEVNEYEMLEQLGAGAFGCVYTVRKKHAPLQFYALKEIYMMESKEISPDKSFGDVISEVRIIKQQLRHPNIVRYRRIFVENQRLYIVMDLIDGASLKEHIHSTSEKKTRFVEHRIWNMLVQLVLALRYLHKDKRIVHRDLKPNNIMLCEGDRVVITDFGLAKQRNADYLKSAAGTIVYSCPEIVQNLPYGDKADVWSLGCCVYELCNLRPAFFSQNMLKLTLLIVEGSFDPVVEVYSEKLRLLVSSCLRPSAVDRPDIVQVGEKMAERIMMALDDQIRTAYKKAKDEAISSFPTSSSFAILPVSSAHPLTKREDSLNSSSNSEVLSVHMKEVRERENGERKRVRLPKINNCIEKLGPPKRKEGKGKSFSAGSRTTINLSHSLPRISGAVSSQNIHQPLNASPLPSFPSMASQGKVLRLTPLQHGRRASSSSSVERNQRIVALRSAALRPISDPVVAMLAVLQRLIVVCDLPPPEGIDHKRRMLEHLRRRLFGKSAAPEGIKTHLRKLATEAHEVVDLDLGYADFRAVMTDLPLQLDATDDKMPRVTYEQVAAVLQMVYSQAVGQR